MTSGLRQAGLVALALSALAFIGAGPGHPSAPTPPAPAAMASVTATTLAFTAETQPQSPVSSAPSTSIIASTAPSTTSAPRPVTVVARPEDAAAELTASVGGEEMADGTGTLETSVSGSIEVEVTAEGHRPEQVTIPADRSGTVDVWLDPPDQLVDRTTVIQTGSAPKQVAFTPDGEELWVALLGGSGLEVYDPDDGARLAAIELPEAGSVEVVFDQSGTTAYVSQMETASVYEIDTATHELGRRFQAGGSWTKVLVLSPDESTLWASNWVSNDVSEIDLDTGTLVRRIPTVTTPRGMAVDSDGTKLYVAGYEHGEIEVVDLASGDGTVIHRSGGAMRHMVADHRAGVVYASDMATDQILTIDSATDEVTELAVSDRLPNTIDVSPDGRVLAVSNRGRNNPETYHLPGPEWGTILLLDTRTGAILDAVVGGNQPTGLDIAPDGRRLAYSDFLDDRVTVVSLPPTARLAAGGGGRAGSYQADIAK